MSKTYHVRTSFYAVVSERGGSPMSIGNVVEVPSRPVERRTSTPPLFHRSVSSSAKQQLQASLAPFTVTYAFGAPLADRLFFGPPSSNSLHASDWKTARALKGTDIRTRRTRTANGYDRCGSTLGNSVGFENLLFGVHLLRFHCPGTGCCALPLPVGHRDCVTVEKRLKKQDDDNRQGVVPSRPHIICETCNGLGL